MSKGITFEDKQEAKDYAFLMKVEGFGARIYHADGKYKVVITNKSDEPRKYWHWTLAKYVPSILETGLKPRGGKGSSHESFEPEPDLVHLYSDKDLALEEGKLMEIDEGEYASALLEITIPPTEEHISKLSVSDYGNPTYRGTIDPKYIKRIR